MGLLETIILAILQGLTEFLPVSSSGHLVLGGHFLNHKDSADGFEIVVHFGTLLSVLIYFRRDILELLFNGTRYFPQFLKYAFMGLKKNIDTNDIYHAYYMYFIAISAIPAAWIGISYKDELKALLNQPNVAAICLMFTGVFLFLSRFAKERGTKLGGFFALLIGCAQAIAILPGISRSGATIVTGLFIGLKREFVAKFSFLMSLPVIGGAFLLQVKDMSATTFEPSLYLHYSIGLIVSAVFGYFAIKIVMNFVKQGKLDYFSYYCIALGGISYLIINF